MLAVAKLIGGKPPEARGSAFAISAEWALTARHCVFDHDTMIAPLEFALPRASPLLASVVHDDETNDVALLHLDGPLPDGWEPVPVYAASQCKRGTPFLVRGFPVDRPFEDDAERMDGHLVDLSATAFGGVPVIALFSPQVAAPEPRDPHGFSGGPVLVPLGWRGQDVAIGLVRWGDVDPNTQRVRAGSVLATPLEQLASRWTEVAHSLRLVSTASAAERSRMLPAAGTIRSFVTQYLGDSDHTVPFGGRQLELTRLNTWLTVDDHPYFLLLAAGGLGKSALLVRWLAQTETPAIHVPISLRYDLSREVPVLRALGARLAAVHGEETPTGDADALRDAVSNLLSLPNDGGLAVIIDGLDEAEDWEPGPALFGGPPADGVKVLAAARITTRRPDSSSWLNALGWRPQDTVVTTLDPLNQTGVADVLAHTSSALQPLAGDDSAIQRFMRLTAGDPLTLGLYLSDLETRQPENLAAAIDQLPDQAAGLHNVFASWWEMQRRLWAARGEAEGRPVWRTLDVLACARGPLRRGELLAVVGRLTPIDGEVLDDALRALDRFTIRIGNPSSFFLTHPRLADDRRQRLDEDGTLMEPRNALLEWCESVLAAVVEEGPVHASPYVVRHLGDHLEEMGAAAAALLRLVDPAWQAAWSATIDDWNGYARDVQRAESAARAEATSLIAEGKRSDNAAAAVRCKIVEATLADVTALMSGELALQLVRQGVWSERRATDAVVSLNDGDRVRGLGVLAPVLGRDSLSVALEHVAAVEPVGWWGPYGQAMGALAARLAELEGNGAALALVGDMSSGTGRAVALLTLLQAQPRAAGVGGMSILVEELVAISEHRNKVDLDEVFDRLCDSVSAQDVAAALAGADARPDVAIAFVRSRYAKNAGARLGDHLNSYELGILAPWLDASQLEASLAEAIEDLLHSRLRDVNGNLVDGPANGGWDSDTWAVHTQYILRAIARRLPSELAALATAVVLSRWTDNFAINQGLGAAACVLVERLSPDERKVLTGLLGENLAALLSQGGNVTQAKDIAIGLGRCGLAADIFAAAADAGDDGGNWYLALQSATPYLEATSIPEALRISSRLKPLYRPWVLAPVLARMASFGVREAQEALRRATSPTAGYEASAAAAIRTAEDVGPLTCDLPDPDPPANPEALAKAVKLLAPDPAETQHDFSAIKAVLNLLPTLNAAALQQVASAVERVQGVSSRNDLRGPVAIRLAQLGALDSALEVPIDPYVAPRYFHAILRVTPPDRLDTWLATVQRAFTAHLHADARLSLMTAASRRIADCDRQQAWTLLDAWLQRRTTRAELLIDLHGYSPAILAVAGQEAAEGLASWVDDSA